MDLFADLEKLGLKQSGELNILDDGTSKQRQVVQPKVVEAKPMEEKDFLIERKLKCDVCDGEVLVLSLRASKAKKLEPDNDLRPRHQGIDTVKYGVTSCPRCGYTALNKHFNHNSPAQRKWIREAICANYKSTMVQNYETYTNENAVEKYKLALMVAMTRRAKLSEKAFICLNLAWLRAEQAKPSSEDGPVIKVQKEKYQQEFEAFYRQAYDGFQKVLSTEEGPYEGMDHNTLEYIIANMAMYFKEYDVAAKIVSGMITNQNTPVRIKDKCIELKDQILIAKASREG